jgi:hypothetical protein
MIVYYQYIRWSPPHLTETEELELGRQIALMGREHFVREFRKSISKSAARVNEARHPVSSPPRENKDSSPVRKTLGALNDGLQWAGVVVFFVIVASGLVLMTGTDWGRLVAAIIPLSVIVLSIYFVSLYLAMRKFERWTDHLVAGYAAHVARGGT